MNSSPCRRGRSARVAPAANAARNDYGVVNCADPWADPRHDDTADQVTTPRLSYADRHATVR
jgi:hypothetical protein